MDNPLSINTHRGIMKLHQKCDIPYINRIWYRKYSITNIISMKYMTKNIFVAMNSKVEMSLLVHMPKNIVKFKKFPNGI